MVYWLSYSLGYDYLGLEILIGCPFTTLFTKIWTWNTTWNTTGNTCWTWTWIWTWTWSPSPLMVFLLQLFSPQLSSLSKPWMTDLVSHSFTAQVLLYWILDDLFAHKRNVLCIRVLWVHGYSESSTEYHIWNYLGVPISVVFGDTCCSRVIGNIFRVEYLIFHTYFLKIFFTFPVG